MQAYVVMIYTESEGWDPDDVFESKEDAYKHAFDFIDRCILNMKSSDRDDVRVQFHKRYEQDRDEAMNEWCRFDNDYPFAAYVAVRDVTPKRVEEKLDESLDGRSPGGDVAP